MDEPDRLDRPHGGKPALPPRGIELAEPGDVVVIAGKGHEQGQEIAGEKLPFDDRVVAREALGRQRRGA